MMQVQDYLLLSLNKLTSDLAASQTKRLIFKQLTVSKQILGRHIQDYLKKNCFKLATNSKYKPLALKLQQLPIPLGVEGVELGEEIHHGALFTGTSA